jgi:hypothetical protein
MNKKPGAIGYDKCNRLNRQKVAIIKRYLFWTILAALLASCIGLQDDLELGSEVSPTTVRGVLATVGPESSMAAAPIFSSATPAPVSPTAELPTAVPTATQTVFAAAATGTVENSSFFGFSGLRFAQTADGAAQEEFPPRTVRVFALWEYAGMEPDARIRRIWFRDEQIWIIREEDWNWEEYGGQGTMRDISIFDNEGSGLLPAAYRLQLYVNDELQEEGTFRILEP